MPELGDELTQKIVTKFVTEASDFLKTFDLVQQRIEQVKAQLKTFSKETEGNLTVVANAMKKTFAQQQMKLALDPTSGVSFTQAKANIADYNSAVTIALRQIRSEYAAYAAEQKTNSGLVVAAQKAEQEAVKQALKDEQVQQQELRQTQRIATQERLRELQQQATTVQTLSQQEAKAQTEASQQAKEAYKNEMLSRKEWAEFLKQDQAQKRQQTQEQIRESKQQALIIKELQKETKDAVNQTKDSYQGLRQVLSSFGGVGSTLATALTGPLGVILAIVAALKILTNQLKQAAQYGYDFAKATYQLQIGINAIRRTGVEITLQDVYNNLDKLQEKFGIFSRKELVEGSAALINLTRDFGLTRDQIFELQDAIATLAVVNGRAMDDVQRTVALAISSGYTEGLQRLGVSINRVTIALEAQRLGYGRNYMSLTEAQRAEATYNLILQKTAKYQDDLASYQLKAPGMIDSLKTSWKDLTTEIGNLVMVYGVYAKVLDVVLESIVNFVREVRRSKINELFMEQAGNIAGAIAVFEAYTDKLKGKPIVGSTEEIFNTAKRGFISDLKEPVIETGWLKNAIEETEKMTEELPPIAEEIGNKLLEIEEDYEERSADAWEDYLQDREDLFIQYGQKGEDIERQFTQKLEDLDIKVAQQNEDAWTNYYQDLEDINIWYNQAVEEANYDHQQDLLKAEEDFQNKMRDLRQSFLFDLEDAIRERDAKQAMLLIRQYNFDRQQAEQNRDDNIEDINRQYKIELAELKKQKARKLIELKDELNRRLAEIQLEYQRELEELAVWKQREYAERELWYQRELEQAKTNYDRQLEEANRYRDKQLYDLAKYMNKEYILQGRQLNYLYKLIEAYIGANGYLTKLWEAYNTYVSSISAIPSTLTPAQQFHWGGSFANGGEITVSKPTLAMFGERGTETATFTKGNKSNGAKGKIQIELLLSPDLEARIIDSAVGEVASEFETAISIKR